MAKESKDKVKTRWERFCEGVQKLKGRTPQKVSRKDEFGATWDVYQTLDETGRVVAEIREDRV